MKNLIFVLILFTIFLTACESEGKMRINNYTAHNVYFTFDNSAYTLAESTYTTVSKKITKSWNPFADNEKKTILTLFGETYIYQKKEGGEEITDIEVTLKADQTLNLYCTANRACVELQNLTDHAIVDFHYQQFIDGEYKLESDNILGDDQLDTDEYVFHRLIPTDDDNVYSYVFSATDSLDNTTISARITLDEDQKYYFILE